MKHHQFFDKHPVFTTEEFARYMSARGGVESRAQDTFLATSAGLWGSGSCGRPLGSSLVYSSSVVRVQKERAQTVISAGPYRYVRHPICTGACLFFPGTALLLGSWYEVLCTPVFIGLFAVRAVLE